MAEEALARARDWQHDGSVLGACRLAKSLIDNSMTILGENDSLDDALVASAALRLHRERCGSPLLDRNDNDARCAAAFLYVTEAQLVLRLVDRERAAALDDGAPLGAALAAGAACEYDPAALSLAVEAARRCMIEAEGAAEGRADVPGVLPLAFGACFRVDDEAPSWKAVCTAETLTSHAGAVLVLRQKLRELLAAAPPEAPAEADCASVREWHREAMGMQHSDEFMCEICDMLIWRHMFEFESESPEVCRVYDMTKPRQGYHWFTRLRAARPPDECNALYDRCSPRTDAMDEENQALSILPYMQYHMKHSGIDDWREVCYFDEHYPRECLRAMERRASARVGELRPPPMLLRADGHYHVIHAVLGRLSVVERCETLEEGVLRWSAYFLRVCDGMFAPRVTCKHLLEKITGQQQRLEDELDLEDEMKEASTLFDM